MDGDKTNALAWERAERYRHLKIGRKTIATPYFSNQIGLYFRELMQQAGVGTVKAARVYELYKAGKVPFGWYRGKGTPEELEAAVAEIAGRKELDLGKTTSASIREFMKEAGLGVDCSGLVYEIMAFALGRDRWMKISGRDRFHLGSADFAGRLSRRLDNGKPGPLDLILVRKKNGVYGHVAVILEKSGRLYVFQSTDTSIPTGVTCDGLDIIRDQPVFEFKPARGPDWQRLYDENRLEFRRLNI